MKSSRQPQRGLTFRAALISIIAIVVMSYWTQYSELVISSTSFNSIHPSIAGFFVVTCLVLFINPVLRVLRYRWGVTQAELLLIYAALIVTGPIVSIGGVHFLLPALITPFYFATPENEYAALFHPHIPPWFSPQTPQAVQGFYEGGVAGAPWGAWARPLFAWTLFLLAVYFLFLCLNVIMRKQWVDYEKLTFPLVHLPLEMTRPSGKPSIIDTFFKNRLMWLGFLLPLLLHGLNGLSNYVPSVPYLQYKHININRYFTEKPWSAMGSASMSFFPCLIGFAYVLTLEVAFSCWFFYIFAKLEAILGAAMGLTRGGSAYAGFPFIEHQGAGAFIAIGALGLWIGKSHVKRVFAALFQSERRTDDADEPMPYRWAVFGFIGGFTFLAFWSKLAGMSIGAAVAFFGLFCVFALALSRIRIQTGLGCVHGPLTPNDLILMGAGTVTLGAQNLTLLAHYGFMTSELRGVVSVMPSQLEGFRIAESIGMPMRHVLIAIIFGTVIALGVGYYTMLTSTYNHVGNLMNGWRFHQLPGGLFIEASRALQNPKEPNWVELQFVALGFLFTLFLTLMRLKFIWWPFHPVGYASAFTGRTVHWVWMPMFIGWLCKALILRHGGIKMYRRFTPFFLGLVLGDFFMGGFWGAVGLFFPDQQGYLFFP
jgi:hypothetical protein